MGMGMGKGGNMSNKIQRKPNQIYDTKKTSTTAATTATRKREKPRRLRLKTIRLWSHDSGRGREKVIKKDRGKHSQQQQTPPTPSKHRPSNIYYNTKPSKTP